MFYVSLSVAGSYFSHVLSPPRHHSSLLIYSWQSHGGCSIIADKWFFKTLSPLVFFLFPSYPYLSLLLVAETVGFLCTLTLFISLQGKTELSFLTHCQSLSSSKVFHLIYTFFFFFPMDLAFSFRCSKFPSLLQYLKAPSISALLSALKPPENLPLLPVASLLCTVSSLQCYCVDPSLPLAAPSCSASGHLKNAATASSGRRINIYHVTCSGLRRR